MNRRLMLIFADHHEVMSDVFHAESIQARYAGKVDMAQFLMANSVEYLRLSKALRREATCPLWRRILFGGPL